MKHQRNIKIAVAVTPFVLSTLKKLLDSIAKNTQDPDESATEDSNLLDSETTQDRSLYDDGFEDSSKTQSEFYEIARNVLSKYEYYFDGYEIGDYCLTLHVWYRKRNGTYDMFITFAEDGSYYSTHNPYDATAPKRVADEICQALRNK